MVYDDTKHLLLRAGFGPAPDDVTTPDVSALFRHKPLMLQAVPRIQTEKKGGGELERKELFRQVREQALTLNRTWISFMTTPEQRFREKMTLFWHDHFACRVRAPFLSQQNNNVLRQHALGSFRTLLRDVSKDPAMLLFLNNQQNRKNHPNENFARELMELFTMGRGTYSEKDVKEAARAFTGWAFNPVSGAFVFRHKAHDAGPKTFLGKQGKFQGDDIIDMILDRRETASFIVNKVYKHFINEASDPETVSALGKDFYEADYSIERLMRRIFESDDFKNSRHRGNRIKSPVELLAGIMTQSGGTFENPNAAVFIQRALGQVLFFPPNVGGWPTGRAWIDSSSLAFRLSLPSILFGAGEVNIDAKDDGDVNNVTNSFEARRLSMRVDWELLAARFPGSPGIGLEEVEAYLLARPAPLTSRARIRDWVIAADSPGEGMRRAFLGFMSLPEYQLS